MTALEMAAAIAGIVGAGLTLLAFLVALWSVKHARDAARAAEHAAALSKEAAATQERTRERDRLLSVALAIVELRMPQVGWDDEARARRIRALGANLTALLAGREDLRESDTLAAELSGFQTGQHITVDAAFREVFAKMVALEGIEVPDAPGPKPPASE